MKNYIAPNIYTIEIDEHNQIKVAATSAAEGLEWAYEHTGRAGLKVIKVEAIKVEK